MAVAPTGLDIDQGTLDNIAALSPCPVCGAMATGGPEGWARAHIPHCWRCGYNWTRPAPAGVNAPVMPSLQPAQVQSLAAAVVAQLKEAGWAPPAAAPAAIDAASTETGGST